MLSALLPEWHHILETFQDFKNLYVSLYYADTSVEQKNTALKA
jgi:hypothetical protein